MANSFKATADAVAVSAILTEYAERGTNGASRFHAHTANAVAVRV
jgi:hypothetical protein